MTATKASSKSNSGRKGSSSSNSKGNYGRLSKRPQPPTSTPSSNNRNSSPHSSSSIKSNNVNKKNKTKVIPKSKHHTIIAKSSSSTKRNNYSIKKRVAAVKANKIIKATYLASGKQRKSSAISSSLANNNNNNFSKTKNGIRKASGGGGGGRSNDVVINGGRRGNLRNTRSNSKIRGNKKTTSKYHMRLPGGSCNPISNNNNNRYSFNTNTNNNSDQHVKYSDVPWFDAESQERFRDNHTSTTASSSSSSSSSSGASPSLSTTINTSSVVAATTTTEATTTLSSSATTTTTATTLPQLPSETILQAMDDELHSFSIYVRLTHTERRAREKFLDHVAEQATSALLGIPSSSSSSSYRSNKNGAKHYGTVVGGKGRRGGETGGHTATADERRGVRVVPFGSFATQEVCCFASDVDMCLWGVVECESPSAMAAAMSRNNGGDVFIGDDDARDVDSDDDGDTYDDFVHANDDDADDRVMLLGRSGRSLHDGEGGDGCPLLTESSLLRTMDAIQSASAAASGDCGGSGLVAAATAAKESIDGAADAAASSVMGVKVSGTKRKQQQQHMQRRQSQNDDINHENEECLFFIDRVGEAAEGADSKVIDSIQRSAEGRPSNINASFASEGGSKDRNRCPDLEEHEDLHDVVAKDSDSVSSSVEGFHFDIDREGVQELGGCISGGDVEVVDLTTTDGGLLPDDAKVSTSQLNDQRAQEESVVDNRYSNVKSSCQVANGRIGSNVRREEESNLGTSALNSIIEINDDSDDDTSEVIMVASVNSRDDVDEDDNDSADKMSSYYHRQNPASDVQISRTGLPASPIVLLNDDSSSSTGDLDDDYSSSDSDLEPLHTSKKEVMELSLTSDIDHNGKLLSGLGPGQRAKKPVMGPTGKARTQVVSALVCLTRQLRMCNFTHTIECRTKARVPIINCSTRTGFEGDIAIGGHNGVDTSMYAMSQVKRFRSFAPVVLLLKIILAQQGLDKPFTGGLGSYRLYVLAALAIERHISNGGNDRPSEILISLLVRYGCIGTQHQTNQSTMTDLERLREKKVPVSCDGGVCDLELVFRIGDCVDVFRECHERLCTRILMVNSGSDKAERLSFLSSMIDCFRLREARETSDRRSKMCDTNTNTPIARNDSGKVNGGRKIGKVFSKNDGPENWKRSPRGNLAPKHRPDLEARRRGDADTILQRATKNRKNSKKQKRDVALREFASRQLQHG